MFKRLKAWFENHKVREPEMVTVWGIQSAPWRTGTPGYPRGVPVALRTIRRDSVPCSESPFLVPRAPRRLKQHGLLNDSESVKARHRAWLVQQTPDASLFL